MKRLLTFLCLAFAGAASAATTTLAPLPSPEHLDMEVMTNCAMTAWTELTRKFDFTLEFNATPSNNVQIAFGTDADTNGILSAEETAMVIGWDCGNWFVSRQQEDTRFSETNAVQTERKTLHFEMRVRDDGTPRELAIKDGSAAIFQELTASRPTWIYDKAWNLIRLTARGVDAQKEQFKIQIAPDGFSVIVR